VSIIIFLNHKYATLLTLSRSLTNTDYFSYHIIRKCVFLIDRFIYPYMLSSDFYNTVTCHTGLSIAGH